MVLCGTNSTRTALNHLLRARRGFSGPLPQPGERVICLRNQREQDLFNGLTGVLKVLEVKDHPEGETPLDSLEIATEPLAMVVGAEGRGLAPLVKRRCDVRCRIPLYGPVGSLNVSVATAVALFGIASRRHKDG